MQTRGYSVELVQKGRQFRSRTDEAGKQARLEWSSAPPLWDAFVEWQYVDGQECQAAQLLIDEMRYGYCGEVLLPESTGPSMWQTIKGGKTQAEYLYASYASFTASTRRGTVNFTGTGSVAPTKAEQRAIAEWAKMRYQEASVNHVNAVGGLQLYFHSESAIFCGSQWVYQTGLGVAWNCAGSEARAVGFLPPDQLDQFYQWLDSGKSWSISRAGMLGKEPFKLSLSLPESSTSGTSTTVRQDELLALSDKSMTIW